MLDNKYRHAKDICEVTEKQFCHYIICPVESTENCLIIKCPIQNIPLSQVFNNQI